MTVLLSIPMNEGKDVHLNAFTEDATVQAAPAVLRSRGCLPLVHGMEPGEPSWSFEQVEDRLYVVNGRSRMQAYDGNRVSRASLAPPVGDLQVKAERIALRVEDEGWVSKFTAVVDTAAASPNIRLTSIAAVDPTNWLPSLAMVGKLILIPSNRYFGAAADGPDILGRIVDVASETQIDIEPVGPAFDATSQDTDTDEVLCFYFDAEQVEDLPKSTPYTEIRPTPNGADEPTDTHDQDGAENPQALEFHGSHALKIETELPQDVVIGPGTVIEFKAYFRPTRLATGYGERQIIWQRRGDEKAAALELSIVENGKVEFRFWDRKIKDYRSIRTDGIPFTEGHWHYFRFRYKFKSGGMDATDAGGGWESDQRWIHRDATGKKIHNLARDGLWVWDLESENARTPLLVIPGCHNAFDQDYSAANSWVNRSRMPGNVGLLKASPWIGPERTDALYTWGGLGGTPNLVAYRATFAAGVAGADGNEKYEGVMVTGLYLPRWFSLNRDIGVAKEATDRHINQADATSYYHGTVVPASKDSLGSGVCKNQAVLCYVFGTNAGVLYTPPRILAVQDLYGTGAAGAEDIGIVDKDGSNTTRFTLTDDPELGGDGGGALAGGATDYIIAFCLPNGENHAGAATGNTSALPTLLVQGPNPVGLQDDPDPEDAPFYIGGSPDQEKEAHALTGLYGVLDDVAFSVLAVDDTQAVYTADHMMPDTAFTGPVDTRMESLPALNIGADTGTNNEDVVGCTVAVPLWSSNLNSNRSGATIAKLQGAVDATIEKMDTKVQGRGKHLVCATFYDPESGVESPPGPISEIEVAAGNDPAEDERLDAAYKLRVQALSISGDLRPRLWRRVYKTLPDGAIFFRAAEVRDNRSRSLDLNPTTSYLAIQPQVDLSYLEPPICSVIRANEQRMFFAGIRDAIRSVLGERFVETPRVVAWSQAFKPWQVPGTNREILESGKGSEVRGLAYLTGRMFALYPDALFVADEIDAVIRWRRVQANVGALSPFGMAELEDYIALPSEKGVYALDASSRMLYLSPALETTWAGLHAPALRYAQGVYNRPRNQYQLSVRERLRGEFDLMLTGEVSDSPFAGAQDGLATAPQGMRPVWSKQIHPAGLEALHASDDPFTGRRIVLMGSGMGFALLMDVDSGVRGHEEGALYGDLRGAIDSVIDTGVWQLKDLSSVDTAHHGLAGIPWVLTRPSTTTPGLETFIAQGVVFELGDDLILRVLRRQQAPYPSENDLIYLGGWRVAWRSKWFGAERLVKRERAFSLELLFEPVDGGYLRIDWFQDFSTVASKTKAVPMDKGYALVPIDIQAHYLQFEVSRFGLDPSLSLFGFGIRHRITTQRQ